MAKDGDKKNQDLMEEEKRSGTWSPSSSECFFSLKVLASEFTAHFPFPCIFQKLLSAPKDVLVFIKM